MSTIPSQHTNANVPEGMRLYAIGDIHGRSDLLERLLDRVEADRATRNKASTVLIFLGDYVDRGFDSKGVVSRLIGGLPADITPIFLKGNHEDLLLTFLEQPSLGVNWLYNGGDAALMSYGVEVEVINNALRSLEGINLAAAIFRELMPENHQRFFRDLRLNYRLGDYFFVHAGIRPGVPLDEQSEEDLLWIRKEFLTHREAFGAVVVHGHTPSRAPENLHNRIGIDTLAFHTGKLTAVGLEGNRRWFLST